MRWRLQDRAAEWLPTWSVGWCCRRPVGSGGVGIRRTEHGFCYEGLARCGSVWACPVCQARIAQGRREELRRAVEAHEAAGGRVALVTYTLAHRSSERLEAVLGRLLGARRRMRSGRDSRQVWAGVGTVRALEVTWGPESGWHPHVHEVVFLPAGVDLVAWSAAVRDGWVRAVRLEGGSAVGRWAVDVRYGDQTVADYVAKYGEERRWGPVEEATQAAKQAGKGRYSLLDLLGSGLREQWLEAQQALRGRRALFWSGGLRGRLGLGAERADAELAESVDVAGEVVAVVPREVWFGWLQGRGDRLWWLEQATQGRWDRLRALGVMVVEDRSRGAPETALGVAVG